MNRANIYQTSKIVGGETTKTIENKNEIIQSGKCPRKNYLKKTDENYVFFSGTVRPPYAREFNLAGVT